MSIVTIARVTSLRLDEFLPYRLSYTTNLVSGMIARAYDALFGLSIPEWRLVAVAGETGEATQAQIGQRTRMDKVTVSRAARALVGRGLLARASHPGDRRSHLLTLTRAGHDLYEQIAPRALALERRIFAGFDAAELASLSAMLRRIDSAALALGGEDVIE